LAMVPPLQFDYWGWVSLALTAPVFLWSGWPFHVSTAVNLRHRAVTMDTLITVGTTAAFLWSLAALLFGTAGHADMRHGFDFALDRGGHGDGLSDVYFEVVAGVITFVLLGRFLEKRSQRSAGAALRALLALGAKDVRVVRHGGESRTPVGRLRRPRGRRVPHPRRASAGGLRVHRPARGDDRGRRHRARLTLRRRRLDAHGRIRPRRGRGRRHGLRRDGERVRPPAGAHGS